jgi:hypothetical protein
LGWINAKKVKNEETLLKLKNEAEMAKTFCVEAEHAAAITKKANDLLAESKLENLKLQLENERYRRIVAESRSRSS